MKTFLKYLPYWIICAVSFTVITLMDLVWILTALCIRATRLIFNWLISAFYPDDDTNEFFEDTKALSNIIINEYYKFFIDLMYPTWEEDFEDEEDEDDSLYDDDED
jgi:hypothetical protein